MGVPTVPHLLRSWLRALLQLWALPQEGGQLAVVMGVSVIQCSWKVVCMSLLQ